MSALAMNSLPDRRSTMTIRLTDPATPISKESIQLPPEPIEQIEEIIPLIEPNSSYHSFQIIPHSSIKNNKADQFADVIAESYQELFKRMMGGDLRDPERVFFETVMTKDSFKSFLTTGTDTADMIKQQSRMIWKDVTVQESEAPMNDINDGQFYEFTLRYPFFMSLKTDRRLQETPLNEILEVSRFMQEGDQVFMQFGIQSAEKEWYKDASADREDFEKKPPKTWRKKEYHQSTELKPGQYGFDFCLRLYIQSTDQRRRSRLGRSLILALKQLNEDNELIAKERKSPKYIEYMKNRHIRVPMFIGKRQIITGPEIAHFIKLPQRSLQQEFKIIETVSGRETNIPGSLKSDGVRIGNVTFRGKKIDVNLPIKDHDQLCLPSCIIGGMGSGKTKGFACTRAYEFVRHGYSAIMIDPAKSEMWEQMKDALPPEKRQRYLLGKDLISLDFREVMHAPQAKARLAQIMLAFFEDNTDDAGSQTKRFLRAAVMGMQSGRISEVIRIFMEKKYREGILSKMPEGMNKETLQQFHNESEARQRQIVSPIFNRLDIIMGDPYLEACMETDKGIDMVDVLSKRGMCTVIDVPDRMNTRAAKDLLINLISFKIDAAMSLRKDEFPMAVLFDEPHQYLRSAKLWKNVAVESRKYKVAYHWLFHSFEQIPKGLSGIIMDAGPHFYIYPSSKKTYVELREEISPFTAEDGLSTKRYHAICALKVGDDRLTPFMAQMTPPPAKT